MSANTRKPAASSRTERATAKSSRHSSRNTPAISHASDTGSLSSSPPANPATRRTNTSVSVTTSSDCRSKRSLKTLPHARSVNTIPIPAHPLHGCPGRTPPTVDHQPVDRRGLRRGSVRRPDSSQPRRRHHFGELPIASPSGRCSQAAPSCAEACSPGSPCRSIACRRPRRTRGIMPRQTRPETPATTAAAGGVNFSREPGERTAAGVGSQGVSNGGCPSLGLTAMSKITLLSREQVRRTSWRGVRRYGLFALSRRPVGWPEVPSGLRGGLARSSGKVTGSCCARR